MCLNRITILLPFGRSLKSRNHVYRNPAVKDKSDPVPTLGKIPQGPFAAPSGPCPPSSPHPNQAFSGAATAALQAAIWALHAPADSQPLPLQLSEMPCSTFLPVTPFPWQALHSRPISKVMDAFHDFPVPKVSEVSSLCSMTAGDQLHHSAQHAVLTLPCLVFPLQSWLLTHQ